jgi:hypothetical protein
VVDASHSDDVDRKALAVELERAMLAARKASRDLENPDNAKLATLYPALRSLVRLSDLDELRVGGGPAWRRFADASLVELGQRPVDPRLFTQTAPLPVVDGLADFKPPVILPFWLSARDSEDERRYLTARVFPNLLTEDDLMALGWQEELDRRRSARGLPCDEDSSELYRLLSDAIAGRPADLDRLLKLLPKDNAARLRQLINGADKGDWPTEYCNDRGLWPLMYRLWSPDLAISPKRSAFHQWAAFYRAYLLIRSGKFDQAWSQMKVQPVSPKPLTHLHKEIENLRAYSAIVRTQDCVAAKEARSRLNSIQGSQSARVNLVLVRDQLALTVNARETLQNPYLVLGVDHGASHDEWTHAWRRLRAANREDIGALSQFNQARDAIMAIERGTGGGVFIVPLDSQTLAPQLSKPSTALVPAQRPYPNKTRDQFNATIERLRTSALREVLDQVALILGGRQ